MENPDFLKKKYDLHNAPEVKSASKRTEKHTGEKVPQNPADQIQNYLERFKEIIDRKDPEEKEMGMQALKKVLHDKFVIKDDEIPEAYYENQSRLAREQGHGDIEIAEEQRKQLSEVVIADQTSSLDNWIDYLSSDDATYPDWLKYYAFRNITQMGAYDKEKKEFSKRSKGTTKPFPDLNREALAYVLDAIEKKSAKEHIGMSQQLNAEDKMKFEKLLAAENFPKLYSWAIDKLTPASIEQLSITKGTWVKYDKGDDHMPLVKSLQGHGTGWCTAGESTAKTQLSNGDFYVFYSEDLEGDMIVPRAAIRMEGDRIAEVRGIAHEQNLDSYIAPVVEEKMKEFPDGKSYEKKSVDMKHLTEIENKTKKSEKLNKEDLIFLYEINSSIEGFGYQKDPRIKEFRDQRNSKEDAPIVFDCATEQIAWKKEDINKDTKAYIGPLFEGIFKKEIEYIFTSFPEGRIQKSEVEIGGKTKDELKKEIKQKGYTLGSYAESMMDNSDFTVSKKIEKIDTVRLKVSDLGFNSGNPTTDEIYARAEKLGLELCPAEIGPYLRLEWNDQPKGNYLSVAMKKIDDSDRRPSVFRVSRYGGGEVWLDTYNAEPSREWNLDREFLFRFRKS